MGQKSAQQGTSPAPASDAPPARTGHPYYMYDSIHEMGHVLKACLREEALDLMRGMAQTIVGRGTARVFLVGCGTSLNIGKTLTYCLEQNAGLPARALDSFEFLSYPPPDLDVQATVIAISHSGSSLTTVRAAEFARQRGAYTIGMVGNPKGRLASVGNVTLFDPGGVEINGPKIRSYTVSCFQGLLLSLMTQEIKAGTSLIDRLAGLPEAVERFIAQIEPQVKAAASDWAKQVSSYMVVGSGSDAGNATEIALKILETVPPPANGFDVEEYTHGPILSMRPERGLIILQGTAPGKKRCVEAAYAASAVTNNILVITADPQAGWPGCATVWPIPSGFDLAAFLLTPIPAQVLVYYLCLAFGSNADRASASSPQIMELYRRAFPPGTH